MWMCIAQADQGAKAVLKRENKTKPTSAVFAVAPEKYSSILTVTEQQHVEFFTLEYLEKSLLKIC